MTRHFIHGEGAIDLIVNLNGPLGQRAKRESEKRGVRIDVLAAMIVESALRHDLVGAILDDEK